MRISWSGMPTAEDAKRTAEAWLEGVPEDIAVSQGIDPGASLRIVFGLDHLSSGDVGLLGRERFRKHSALFLDDYLNAVSYGVKKRAVWLAGMVGALLFPSQAEADLFRVMYPGVATQRYVVSVVQVPEKKVEKRRRKRKVVDVELGAWDAASGADLADFEKMLDENVGADPEAEYEGRLADSAADFWGLVRRLAV